MSRMKKLHGLSGSGVLFKPIFYIVLILLLISLLVACSPAATTQAPTSNTSATSTATPATTGTADPKPQGELVAALQGFGSENFLPWLDPKFATPQLLIYDMLIYWDHINHNFLPGLAESWEVSEDGMTTTYHLRKGVQFTDGWGELTSADVAYDFAMHRSLESLGKTEVHRRVASTDEPDPYTLIVHMKTPYPTFFADLSMANSGVSQGIVCKKYIETVGTELASQKPIGSGPFRLVESKLGSYYKFEALDSHWRVVPEFKNITIRLLPEISSYVAGLKNQEIDLSEVSPEQILDLKASGLAVEVNPVGGSILNLSLGGMVIPQDKYYDAAYHNKDPWVDSRVRKAMAIAIDREAICKAIYAGYADPAGVPLLTLDSQKYQYAYDPAQARQLLKDAGYPDGFSFKAISNVNPLSAEAPRVIEAVCGYWEQIGIKPKIVNIDYATYLNTHIIPRKTAGEVYLTPINTIADQLAKYEASFIPGVTNLSYQDAAEYAIYEAMPKNASFDERNKVVAQINQYFYDNVGPIPVARTSRCFAWNPAKIGPWPHIEAAQPLYLEYVRHAQPHNTFRLFNIWPGR